MTRCSKEFVGVDIVLFNTFEHRVKFSDGSTGFADCFCHGRILVEMKSRGKDLEAAYTQALECARSLGNGASFFGYKDIDFVACWYAKARGLIQVTAMRCAFYRYSKDIAYNNFIWPNVSHSATETRSNEDGKLCVSASLCEKIAEEES